MFEDEDIPFIIIGCTIVGSLIAVFVYSVIMMCVRK